MNKRVLSGVLSTLLTLILLTSGIETAFAKNNLLSKQAQNASAAHKAAFLLYKPNTDVILEKYANATSLTDLELVEMLKIVGFKGKGLKIAWAVAKAESNGRPLAYNGNIKTGDSSFGVFQINMLKDLGPDRRDKFKLDHNADLFNPVINAQAAFYMTDGGTNWSSWTTYNKGVINKWLNKFPEK